MADGIPDIEDVVEEVDGGKGIGAVLDMIADSSRIHREIDKLQSQTCDVQKNMGRLSSLLWGDKGPVYSYRHIAVEALHKYLGGEEWPPIEDRERTYLETEPYAKYSRLHEDIMHMTEQKSETLISTLAILRDFDSKREREKGSGSAKRRRE